MEQQHQHLDKPTTHLDNQQQIHLVKIQTLPSELRQLLSQLGLEEQQRSLVEVSLEAAPPPSLVDSLAATTRIRTHLEVLLQHPLANQQGAHQHLDNLI